MSRIDDVIRAVDELRGDATRLRGRVDSFEKRRDSIDEGTRQKIFSKLVEYHGEFINMNERRKAAEKMARELTKKGDKNEADKFWALASVLSGE